MRRIVARRPDVVLLAGGTDGGNRRTILANAAALAHAEKTGATQKTQSWRMAAVPAKTAEARLRAGFNPPLETGMAIRYMLTVARPMAMGATVAGARRPPMPTTTRTRTAVAASSIAKTAPMPNAPP